MIVRVPNSILTAEKEMTVNNVVENEPLSFRFYYATNNQADIIDTIYLADGNTPSELVLEVFNESANKIYFNKADGTNARLTVVKPEDTQAASRTRCHFQIRWATDLALTPDKIDIEGSQQWQVNYDYDEPDKRFFSIYFLHKDGMVLSAKGSDNDKIRLTFKEFAANNRDVKTSNVDLLYGGESGLVCREKLDGDGLTIIAIAKQIKSTKAIYVTHYPSKLQIPLQARFLGSNTILNDASTQNSLSLKVINSPLSNNTRPILGLDSTSKFIISFEKGDHPEALVATDDQLAAVKINVTTAKISATTAGWTPEEHAPSSTEWEFTATNIDQLAEGDGITLSITELVTSSASGLGYLYIDYQNIGSYPDGRLVVAIEKTPLLYKDQQVGIGTTNPSAKLHVAGGDAVIYGNVGIGTDNLKGKKLHLSGTVKATENNQTLIGLSVNPTFDNDGKTNVKQLGLEVVGTTATTEAETKEVMRLVRPVQTDVKYANSVGFNVGAFESGRNGKTRLDITLAGGPVSSNEWGYQPDLTVMSLLADGKVGIGTNNPQGKLHVSGTVKATENNQTLIGLSVTPTFDNNSKTGVKQLGLEVVGTTATTQIETKEVMRLVRHGHQNDKNANSVGFNVGAFESGRDGKTQLDITLAGDPGNSNEWGYQPDVKVMSLTADGKVGIGTTSPKKELHVVGDLVLGTDEDNQKFIFHSRKTQNGDFLQITYDKSDGNFEWDQGITLKRGGKVGIGTTNPSATLDVNGTVRLGNGSTAWKRIMCGRVDVVTGWQAVTWPTGPMSRCVRERTGYYKLYFRPPLTVVAENLVVIITPQDKYKDNIANVGEIGTTDFTVQTKDSSTRSDEDSSFHFIVIELEPW